MWPHLHAVQLLGRRMEDIVVIVVVVEVGIDTFTMLLDIQRVAEKSNLLDNSPLG